MSEDTKKVEETEQETKPAELSEQALDKVAGGSPILWKGTGTGDATGNMIPSEAIVPIDPQ